MSVTHNEDSRWMRRCLALAERGTGFVSPNPMVGCVIVKAGRCLAEGWHRRFGGPHAERDALARAGARARGATLYANLEPCCHWGKTPPCTEAILRAGIRRVVAPFKDPNPLVRGKGFAALKKGGVRLTVGALSGEARELNRAFIKHAETGRPYVTLKTAMTLDGKICTRTGASRWITSATARNWVHDLRARVDAVLVGARTVLRDDPVLSSHGKGRDPLRVIVDGRLSLPPASRVFRGGALTVAAITKAAPAGKIRRLQSRGVRTIVCPSTGRGRVDLRVLLKSLGGMFVSHVLVEGGGELNASLLEAGLVDELAILVAPKVFGGREALTPVEGEGVALPAKALQFRWTSVTRLGDDLLLEARRGT